MANAMAIRLKSIYINNLQKYKFLLIIRGSVVQVHLGPRKKAEYRKISAFFILSLLPNSSELIRVFTILGAIWVPRFLSKFYAKALFLF